MNDMNERLKIVWIHLTETINIFFLRNNNSQKSNANSQKLKNLQVQTFTNTQTITIITDILFLHFLWQGIFVVVVLTENNYSDHVTRDFVLFGSECVSSIYYNQY